ncbi:MAG: hypothetical protein IID48_12080 [Proteobacteria bacterium]|nr:hypothetical protein [Pseudomonadota bacterium]
MGKRTMPQLADFIADATGLSESNLQGIARRLREAGHLSMAGRGPQSAATPTPHDAALLLLVAACEVPPLHAVALGEALLACDILTNRDDWPDDLPLAATAVDHAAALIDRPCLIYDMWVIMGGQLQMTFRAEDGGGLIFQPAADDPANAKLVTVLGRRSTTLMRRHEIQGAALRDIGDWLREGAIVAVEEDTAA